MTPRPLWLRWLYRARDLRSRALFAALRHYCRGDVLDVGGAEFFETVRRHSIDFATWTCLESSLARGTDDARFRLVQGDGCAMDFADGEFDTVLNIQVLEHVFEPLRMVDEIGRVLRPGGHAIFLIPQTSTTHLAPDYHCNFSRYWIRGAMERAGLAIVEHRPLGGVWSSMASHHFYFFLQAFRVEGMSDPEVRRPLLFYPLLPLMCAVALLSLPLYLLLSLGDLSEEPNNHLVVAQKPARAAAGGAESSPGR